MVSYQKLSNCIQKVTTKQKSAYFTNCLYGSIVYSGDDKVNDP